ncbi:unnamed protein product, partial [Prorocentrum cordatum]
HGQFDEAILAAAAALPAASLVELLRRLRERRPAEVAAALGAPERAGAPQRRSPAAPAAVPGPARAEEDEPVRQGFSGFEEMQTWAGGGFGIEKGMVSIRVDRVLSGAAWEVGPLTWLAVALSRQLHS